MLFAFANATLHDVPVAVLRVLVATVSFSRGVGAVAFPASFQENLYVIIGIEETTCSATTFPLAIAFTASLVVVLEHSAKSANWSSGEPAPIALSCAVLVVDGFGGFGIGELTQVGHACVLVSVV